MVRGSAGNGNLAKLGLTAGQKELKPAFHSAADVLESSLVKDTKERID